MIQFQPKTVIKVIYYKSPLCNSQILVTTCRLIFNLVHVSFTLNDLHHHQNNTFGNRPVRALVESMWFLCSHCSLTMEIRLAKALSQYLNTIIMTINETINYTRKVQLRNVMKYIYLLLLMLLLTSASAHFKGKYCFYYIYLTALILKK